MNQKQEIKNALLRNFDKIKISEENQDDVIVFEASIRNWGDWQFPEDEYCEDGDDEDCDYEELTFDSSQRLKRIVDKIQDNTTKYNVDYDIGGKNYIMFTITNKKGKWCKAKKV